MAGLSEETSAIGSPPTYCASSQKECEEFGTVYEVEVDRPTRSAICEFKRWVLLVPDCSIRLSPKRCPMQLIQDEDGLEQPRPPIVCVSCPYSLCGPLLHYHPHRTYRSSDAEEAWRKLHRTYMDGRRWKVDRATPADFKFFGWKWTEGGLDDRKARSPSRSR